MISYFPTLYSDELLYSLLSRCYARSGYLTYTFAAQDFYKNKNIKPNIEFLNEYTEEAYDLITKNTPIEIIIKEHTMFPYYTMFLNRDRKVKAFNSLINMNNDYYRYINIPKKKAGTIRYLRYCPICAKEDRELYGETYWHRVHQLIGVNICPYHHCQLSNGNIRISSDGSPSLITAEEVIPLEEGIFYPNNEIECRLSNYVSQVFSSNIDFKTDIGIGDFLHSKLEYTKYLSRRGEQRNMTLFHSDFLSYYQPLTNNEFKEAWKLQKVFTNDRYNTYEICMMAMFMDIPINELTHMKLPEKTQQQLFDAKIKKLHKQGLNYRQIANQMNSSYDLVKTIGEGRYGTYHYSKSNPQRGGAKKTNWDTIDRETLPLVKKTIKQLQSDKINRPKKITMGLILNLLQLPNKRLNNCPLCTAEINKHILSQEEYWAKEVVWATNKILQERGTLNYTRISRLINIRKHNLKACIPYLSKYTDKETAKMIQGVI